LVDIKERLKQATQLPAVLGPTNGTKDRNISEVAATRNNDLLNWLEDNLDEDEDGNGGEVDED